MIKIVEVDSRKKLKTFINLPYKLYKNDRNWIPPLKCEEINALDPSKNPVLDYCDIKLWLAYDNDDLVGRIAGIINYKYIKSVDQRIGRFGWLDVVNNPRIVEALFTEVEEWAKKKNMDYIEGPLGLTALDSKGILVDGFDQPSTLLSPFNSKYYKDYIEKQGYKSKQELIEYKINFPKRLPKKVVAISKRAKKRYPIKVIRPKKKGDLELYIDDLLELFNSSLQKLHSGTATNKKLLLYYKNKLLQFVNPDYVRLIVNQTGSVIAFGVAVPSYTKAFKKAKGKLYPLGFFHFSKALNFNKHIDFFMVEVAEEYRGAGISAVILEEFFQLTKKDKLMMDFTYLNTMEQQTKSIYKYLDRTIVRKSRYYIKKLK